MLTKYSHIIIKNFFSWAAIGCTLPYLECTYLKRKNLAAGLYQPKMASFYDKQFSVLDFETIRAKTLKKGYFFYSDSYKFLHKRIPVRKSFQKICVFCMVFFRLLTVSTPANSEAPPYETPLPKQPKCPMSNKECEEHLEEILSSLSKELQQTQLESVERIQSLRKAGCLTERIKEVKEGSKVVEMARQLLDLLKMEEESSELNQEAGDLLNKTNDVELGLREHFFAPLKKKCALLKKITSEFSKDSLNLLHKWEENLRRQSIFFKEEYEKTDMLLQKVLSLLAEYREFPKAKDRHKKTFSFIKEALLPTVGNSLKIKKLSNPKILKEIDAINQFLSMTQIIERQKIELEEKDAQISVLESKIQLLQKTESETFFLVARPMI